MCVVGERENRRRRKTDRQTEKMKISMCIEG
jgi:hypothetical protein